MVFRVFGRYIYDMHTILGAAVFGSQLRVLGKRLSLGRRFLIVRGRVGRTASVHGGRGERLTPFCPRRARRTATAFCPRRTRRGAENGLHLFVRGGRGGARRTAYTFLSAEDAEGRGERLTPFCPRRTRRGAENGLHLFVRGGRGGTRRRATAFCPRRGAEKGNTLLFAEGGGEHPLFLSESGFTGLRKIFRVRGRVDGGGRTGILDQDIWI